MCLKWKHALHLINHVDPADFFCHRPGSEIIDFGPEPKPATGGVVVVPAVLSTFSENFSEFRILRSLQQHIHRPLSTASWPKGGLVNDSSSVILGF